MKRLMITGLLALIGICSFAQDQENLVCMNTACFEEEKKRPSSISPIEPVETRKPEIKSHLALIPQNASTQSQDTQEYLSSPAYSQNSEASRYFSIVNEQIPFFEKRFMNVRAYDMDYGTNPEFESTRPKIAVDIFRKRTWHCAKTDWQE